MSLLFVYDTTIYSNGQKRYNKMFNEIVVNRYRAIDNDLYICSEFVDETDPTKLNVSSHSNDLYKAINITKINTLNKLFKTSKLNKKILTDAISNVDYVIIRAPSSVAYTAFKICRKLKKPFLTEMVGSPYDALWNHSLKGKLMTPSMVLKTKIILQNSKYSIYVTNRFLQQHYPTKGKSVACSDVTLPKADKKILEKRKERINNLSSKILIGTTAAMDVKFKGQEYVIEAISVLNRAGYDFEYQLVGGGDIKYLKSVSEKYGVADKVEFIGSLPHNEVLEWLDKIDIYIQPSLQEGLPRAVIESLSRACPAVGSVCGGTPELINEKYTFNPKKIDEICNVLKQFDIDTMKKEAERSFNVAKEYDLELLEKRRNDFFNLFIKESESRR